MMKESLIPVKNGLPDMAALVANLKKDPTNKYSYLMRQ